MFVKSHSRPFVARLIAVALSVTFAIHNVAQACPFCSAPGRTLTEQVAQAETTLLVRHVRTTRANPEQQRTAKTDFEVVKVLQDPAGTLHPGDSVTFPRLHEPSPAGNLFVLFGSATIDGRWGTPIEISADGIEYLSHAPSHAVPQGERLVYFARFLESSDPTIAEDAYGEFANADYKDIAAVAHAFDAAKVRGWIADDKTNTSRLGLYGLLLGLSGSAADAEFLRRRILEPASSNRLGVEGLISGYLLLTREGGLEVIEETKLKNPISPDAEIFATIQAVQFMWTYGDDLIGKERLRAAMRILLDRPKFADLVVTDLGRWSDWSILDRLMELYSAKAYENRAIKRAIVRFYLVAEASQPKNSSSRPEHVVKAKAHLATLRRLDPETVTTAEEFFYLNF